MRRKKHNSARKLLLIRFSALGDVAMIIPMIRAFKRAFPDVELSILSKAFPLAVFSSENGLNTIAFDPLKHRGLLGLWQLSKSIVEEGITDVADLHFSLRSRILCLLLRWRGLNVSQRTKQRRLRRQWTSKRPKPKKRLDTQVQAYLKTIAQLGFVLEEKALLDEMVRNRVSSKSQKVGIAPFAAHRHKTYPTGLTAELLKDLRKKYQTVLFGAKGTESQQFDQWVSEGIAHENAAMLSFEMQLQEMQSLGVMISMDSANGHIAANYGVPVITIWGATAPSCGFSVLAQPNENQFQPDPEKYPFLPSSIFGKSTFRGYETAMESIDPKAISKRVDQLMLP
ncbi:MAG: glycosyltransferase family 9 protein [Flavobacteriaceae bacterium]